MTNVINAIEIVSNKIANSTTAQEALFLSKLLEKIKIGNIKLVSSYGDMLDGVYSFGDLYYVETEEAIYYSVGNSRTPLLTSSLQIWGWGYNSGRLGTNNTTSTSSPVSVAGTISDWIQVSAGGYHSVAIRANGTAWAWGLNNSGQLGDGTVSIRSSPVSVVGGFTDWFQVNAGREHSLGLRSNGTIWAWGSNSAGRLGDGTTISKSSPVSVVGGFTDWIQVSAAPRSQHSLGLRSNGTIWAWGANYNGRLGDDTTVAKSSPVSVVGGFTDWIQVSAGGSHSLGLRVDGTAWAWGINNIGQLGDNTLTARSSPVSVVGNITNWIQISGGESHSLALKSDGTIWSWGNNTNGRLGDGSTTTRSSPVSVVGGYTDWVQINAGSYHNHALRSNGTLWGWGSNLNGRLGDGTITSRSSPVSVVGGFADWIQVSAGDRHTHAIRTIRG